MNMMPGNPKWGKKGSWGYGGGPPKRLAVAAKWTRSDIGVITAVVVKLRKAQHAHQALRNL